MGPSQTAAHPREPGLGWDKQSAHMWCLSSKLCLAGFRNDTCVLVTPMDLEVQESRGPPRVSLTAAVSLPHSCPESGPSKICSAREEMGQGLEKKQVKAISGFLPLRKPSHELFRKAGRCL